MNIYDYRTIPPEESAYHARTSHASEPGDDDISEEDLTDEASDYSAKNENPSDPKSTDFGARRKPYK